MTINSLVDMTEGVGDLKKLVVTEKQMKQRCTICQEAVGTASKERLGVKPGGKQALCRIPP